MNLPPKIYNQDLIPPTWLSSQPPSYPVQYFPPMLRNVIRALHDNTQIPVELISNVVLAAASLACQPLVAVIRPHTNMPEQCSLYLLTVAESGEGKTTINKQVMKPFYDFASEMKLAYEAKLSDYKREYKIWKIRQQALDGNLRQPNGYFTPPPIILPNQRFNIVQSRESTIVRPGTVVLSD